MASRGAYAKGVAKREEILAAALDVIAREGYSRTSLKEIADAVGLSKAGVLHYFGSMEELFVEVLRRRDLIDERYATGGANLSAEQLDIETLDAAGVSLRSFVEPIRHNASVPGLMHLYTRLSAEAIEPDHAAHAYFLGRYRASSELVARLIEVLQRAGRVRPDADPAETATMLIALSDGLQLQWLMESDIDMPAHLESFIRMLETP
ncbi:TetR family transcriptional regulator [Agromyces rhizosphaerae]|uniref:TetR family transcriptional regulator n=1 Tax=Agromyces rhizosphaerae TaxID=88374 RepID=A0A9W6CQQ9_9MICO|nr:TetR/AcrR family transcriptional regulator [Agromyces rhizosphaerae]GLI27131.1 TetR family transcriptional regulator [Agromyces rhizosphaerae]